jgi:hypothetical protein
MSVGASPQEHGFFGLSATSAESRVNKEMIDRPFWNKSIPLLTSKVKPNLLILGQAARAVRGNAIRFKVHP